MTARSAPTAPASDAGVRPRRRALRLARLALVAVILPIVVIPTGIGAFGMWVIVYAPCATGGRTPGDYGLSYIPISIPSRTGGAFRGFFIPAPLDSERRNGTIIVPPAFAGGQDGMLYEAGPLARAGYNVLVYESRACAGRSPLSLGYRDVEDIGDALAFLRQNPHEIQVDMDRLALHGFSSAGAASIMAAGHYPEIRAVLAEGGYHDLSVFMGLDGRSRNALESFLLFGTRAAYRLATGDDPAVLNAIDAIGHVPPRPILLIYGSDETSLDGARAMYALLRAAAPDAMAALWVVPGAGHGAYIQAAGEDTYMQRALALYDCALLEDCAAWHLLWEQ